MKSHPSISKKFLRIIMFIILSSFFFTNILNFSDIIRNKSPESLRVVNLESRNLKFSTISGGITIIGDSEWADFKNAGKCTGSGTFIDPYVIEDLVIDANNTIFGIWIQNSNVYFKIENCTVFNSRVIYGFPPEWAGAIKLINVSNGFLVDNNCSFNERGIVLEYSSNNTILGNVVSENEGAWYSGNGICLEFSDNNTISRNFAYDNFESGITLRSSNNNIIEGNVMYNNRIGLIIGSSNVGSIIPFKNNLILGNSFSNNGFSGIDIGNGANNSILNNTLNSNGYYGIALSSSNNTFVEGNTINNSYAGISVGNDINTTISKNIMNGCGIRIWHNFDGSPFPLMPLSITLSIKYLNSYNIDTSNLVNGNPLYYYTNELNLGSSNFTNAGQVILVNCSDSSISNLNISYSSTGISLFYSNNNNITGNSAVNNIYEGIRLVFSEANNISGNIVSNNIRYVESYYTDYYGVGISLYKSNYNNISGNIANNNGINGIKLDQSNNTIITGNSINGNKHEGLNLVGDTESWKGSHYNSISNNTVNNNNIGIHLVISNNNTILGNSVNYNWIGIWLEYSNYNLIIDNTLIGNNECIKEDDSEGNIFINNSSCNNKQTIPGYNLIFLFSILSLTVIIISKRLKKSRKIHI